MKSKVITKLFTIEMGSKWCICVQGKKNEIEVMKKVADVGENSEQK